MEDFRGIQNRLLQVQGPSIENQGLYAVATIPKGTLLGYLEGKFLSLEDKEEEHLLYLPDEKRFSIVNLFKFMSHSSSPNAIIYGNLTVYALRDIKPGEEVTHDFDQ